MGQNERFTCWIYDNNRSNACVCVEMNVCQLGVDANVIGKVHDANERLFPPFSIDLFE